MADGIILRQKTSRSSSTIRSRFYPIRPRDIPRQPRPGLPNFLRFTFNSMRELVVRATFTHGTVYAMFGARFAVVRTFATDTLGLREAQPLRMALGKNSFMMMFIVASAILHVGSRQSAIPIYHFVLLCWSCKVFVTEHVEASLPLQFRATITVVCCLRLRQVTCMIC